MSSGLPPYPEKLRIEPLADPPWTEVRVPGSKSITNRALVLAALCGEEGCQLRGVLRSEDTEMMVGCLDALGFVVETDWPALRLRVYSKECKQVGPIPAREAELFVGNSGTTMRFVTALVGLGNGRYRIDGVPRMQERPIEDLLEALRQLDVHTYSERDNRCPPVVVEAEDLHGGHVRIKGNISSQFLSGLLMAASGAKGNVTIEVEGELVSVPYVTMTVRMMRQWGLEVQSECDRFFRIPGRQCAHLESYDIEPDASAASYFWAAAAIADGSVKVNGITAKSLQGDTRFVDLLNRMGCQVIREDSGITVVGGPLRGIDADMNDISDTVMTLAAVACFAEGPTTIRNVAHIRHKETDRLAALATELRRVGAGVDEFADGLTITPRPLHGAEIETYNDHRMAMSMALIGLKVPGIVIKNPGCVAKTYPHFFDDLERLR
jgi:3-phosphoshikimate 1-carboxyvinyltransferase